MSAIDSAGKSLRTHPLKSGRSRIKVKGGGCTEDVQSKDGKISVN